MAGSPWSLGVNTDLGYGGGSSSYSQAPTMGGGGGGAGGGPWGLLAQGIQDTIGMGVGGLLGQKQYEEEMKQYLMGQQSDQLQKGSGWMIGQAPGEIKYGPNQWMKILQGVGGGLEFSKNFAPASAEGAKGLSAFAEYLSNKKKESNA